MKPQWAKKGLWGVGKEDFKTPQVDYVLKLKGGQYIVKN